MRLGRIRVGRRGHRRPYRDAPRGIPGAKEEEVIALRRGGEQTRVLVGLRSVPCPDCGSGTRTISTWSTLKGTTERISWCHYCFNAECLLAELSEDERESFELACAAMGATDRVRYFDCARHAVEYCWSRGELR